MASRGRTLTVYLASDTSKLGRGLSAAERRLGKFRKGVTVGFGAAAAAVGGLAIAVGEGVQAAVSNEASQSRLARAAKNSAKATDEQIDALEDYVSAQQQRTGIDDEAIRGSMARFLRSTEDITEAQELQDTAMLVALGTGKDYAGVAEAIARAHDGNAGALKRLGINIPKGNKVDLLAYLNKQFAGSIQADMETYAGKARNIASAAGEVQEAFGQGFIDSITGANDAMSDGAQQIYDLQDDAETVGAALGTVSMGLLSIAAEFIASLGHIATGFELFKVQAGSIGNNILDFAGIRSDEDAQAARDAAATQIGDIYDEWARNNRPPTRPGGGRTPTPGGDFGTGVNPSATGSPNRPWTTFDPARYAQQTALAGQRSSARAATRAAKPGLRP